MSERDRQLRWIFGYRVATLGAVAFLLPWLEPAVWPFMGWLVFVAAGLLAAWSAPFWRSPHRRDGGSSAALAVEALVLAILAAPFGGPTSPILLLELPVLAHAAIALPTSQYAAVAAVVLAGYGAVLGVAIASGLTPAWLPLWTGALVLTAVWLGVAGAVLQRKGLQATLVTRMHNRYRGLVEDLAPPERPNDAFWRTFLTRVRDAGGYQSVALIRWEGSRPRIYATDRGQSWAALVKRHLATFKHAADQPAVFNEPVSSAGTPGRAIIAWPVPRRQADMGGSLCVMAQGPISLDAAGRRIDPFLPLAALALVLGTPTFAVQRAAVDWQAIIDATLHRLHGRLARYLVLVHVDPGKVEADGVLLAEAIANLVEDVLDRTPPQTPVRLTVLHAKDGWRFQVETEHPPTPAADEPGMQLARQVVSAHGGAWEQVEDAGAPFRVGFLLPPAR